MFKKESNSKGKVTVRCDREKFSSVEWAEFV